MYVHAHIRMLSKSSGLGRLAGVVCIAVVAFSSWVSFPQCWLMDHWESSPASSQQPPGVAPSVALIAISFGVAGQPLLRHTTGVLG